jgi:hypothetical protein
MATSMGDDERSGRDERLDDDEGQRAPDIEHDPEAAQAANRFDIRRLIGGVFVIYGVVLTILGIFGSEEIKNKASGINVDLWTGLAMLVVGGLMIAWALWRPVVPQRPAPPSAGGGVPSPTRGQSR